MTLFRILSESAGLSQREVARFLEVDERTARRWIAGQQPPDGVLSEMFSLIDRQARAAREGLKLIAALPPADSIEIGVAVDDHDAQHMPGGGWPTASAHAAVIRHVLEMAAPEFRTRIRIVPRGSTPATAAAADQH